MSSPRRCPMTMALTLALWLFPSSAWSTQEIEWSGPVRAPAPRRVAAWGVTSSPESSNTAAAARRYWNGNLYSTRGYGWCGYGGYGAYGFSGYYGYYGGYYSSAYGCYPVSPRYGYGYRHDYPGYRYRYGGLWRYLIPPRAPAYP